MKYQLVLQFPEDKYGDLDFIIALEDMVDASLPDDAMLDGHDVGSGEMNIFIHSNNPKSTFLFVKDLLEANNEEIIENMKAAYRDLHGSEYTYLWPEDLKEFKVL